MSQEINLNRIPANELDVIENAERGQSVIMVDTADNTGLIIDYEKLRDQILAEIMSNTMTESGLQLVIVDDG